MASTDPSEMSDEELLERVAQGILKPGSLPADLLTEAMRRWPTGEPS